MQKNGLGKIVHDSFLIAKVSIFTHLLTHSLTYLFDLLEHASGGHFPDEGWGGKCGNNEVTCHLSGFGAEGKISFDWKHFTYEDYDDWLWSEHGRWSGNDTVRRPDILTVQVGLHTCFHAYTDYPRGQMNYTLIRNHESELPRLMAAINMAISRPSSTQKTMVVIMTAGRIGSNHSTHYSPILLLTHLFL